MAAAEKRVKMLADIVGARGGSRADENGARPIIRLDLQADAEQILSTIKARAKSLTETPAAPSVAPAGKLSAVAIDRPSALLETKRPQDKKPRASRAPIEHAAPRAPAPAGKKVAISVDNMLYRKGAATAATFRPHYWTFDTDPPAETAPRARQAESKTPRSRSRSR